MYSSRLWVTSFQYYSRRSGPKAVEVFKLSRFLISSLGNCGAKHAGTLFWFLPRIIPKWLARVAFGIDKDRRLRKRWSFKRKINISRMYTKRNITVVWMPPAENYYVASSYDGILKWSRVRSVFGFANFKLVSIGLSQLSKWNFRLDCTAVVTTSNAFIRNFSYSYFARC